MPYILYQVIKSLRENSALLVAANSSCFRSAEINCSLPFLNRPRRKRAAIGAKQGKGRDRSSLIWIPKRHPANQHTSWFFFRHFFFGPSGSKSLFFFRAFPETTTHTQLHYMLQLSPTSTSRIVRTQGQRERLSHMSINDDEEALSNFNDYNEILQSETYVDLERLRLLARHGVPHQLRGVSAPEIYSSFKHGAATD